MAKISSIIIAFLAIVSGFLFYNGLKYLLLPEYAESYFASFASCSCQKNFGTEIKINFVPKEKAKHKIPYYEIQDLPEYGKSVITLHNVESIKDFFSYDEIVNSPLLSSLDYKLEGKNLLVELERKGSCLPLEIIEKEQSIFFILKSGNENYPIITDQKPADSGTASPGFKKISFKAVLKNPLKKFFLSFQGEPVNLSGVDISGGTLPYQYLFEFKANIEKDKEYQVKAIITDNQDQASRLPNRHRPCHLHRPDHRRAHPRRCGVDLYGGLFCSTECSANGFCHPTRSVGNGGQNRIACAAAAVRDNRCQPTKEGGDGQGNWRQEHHRQRGFQTMVYRLSR